MDVVTGGCGPCSRSDRRHGHRQLVSHGEPGKLTPMTWPSRLAPSVTLISDYRATGKHMWLLFPQDCGCHEHE